MRNHKLLTFCMVLVTASMVTMTLWAQEEATENAANMAVNAANQAANIANQAANAANMAVNCPTDNATGNMMENATSNQPTMVQPMRLREVNQKLDSAVTALDEASQASQAGNKEQVSQKINQAKQDIQDAQQSMRAWNGNGGMQRNQTGFNAAANAAANAISNMQSNTP